MESVTQWLELWRDGDAEAIDRVTALVYQDLRRLAAYHLKAESDVVHLQATALVHEAYLRMSSLRSIDWVGRAHFISGGHQDHAPDSCGPCASPRRRQTQLSRAR